MKRPCHCFNFAKVILEKWPKGWSDGGEVEAWHSIGIEKVPRYTIGSVRLGVVLIIAYFIHHKEVDQQGGCHCQCQSGNIDKGSQFVSEDTSESGLKVVLNHYSLI